MIRGTKGQRNPLQVQKDTSNPNQTRFRLEPAGTTTAGEPQDQAKSQDNRTFPINGIIPKTATWSANGIRAANTLTAKFKYVDCPFDPRTIRSCAVELYLGTVAADNYRAGTAGNQRAPGTNVAEPLNLLPEQYKGPGGEQRTNLQFQGFVNKWEIDWDDEEEPVITIECRDNTQLLIDEEAPPGLVISGNKPIDQAIADYLSNFPAFVGLSVQYSPAGATAPTLAGALAGTAYQPQLGPAPARGGGAASKLAVWDYLTDVAGALGHVAVLDGTTIVIQQVKTLFSNAVTSRPDDPFQGRTVDGQENLVPAPRVGEEHPEDADRAQLRAHRPHGRRRSVATARAARRTWSCVSRTRSPRNPTAWCGRSPGTRGWNRSGWSTGSGRSRTSRRCGRSRRTCTKPSGATS